MSDHDWPRLNKPLPLTNDIVHVVRLGLDVDPEQITPLRSILSTDELARADRYKFDEPRRRFMACRAALRQILGTCLGCDASEVTFTYGPHGKPELVLDDRATDSGPLSLVPRPSSLHFSVSHSADLALIAITAGRRVGVDVERHDATVRILKLATRFFSPREAAELASLPEAEQLAGFYRGWTSKEAYLKATGLGLSFPLSKFTVSLNPIEPAALLDVADQPDEAARWRMSSLEVAAGFSASLLVEATPEIGMQVRRWSYTS